MQGWRALAVFKDCGDRLLFVGRSTSQVRAGYLALRHIADFFGVDHDPDPEPTDPISITREEFDEACRELAAAGVPLQDDLDQAWRDFWGWRVNYDTVLVTLSGLFIAPAAPWSSDRSIPFRVRTRAMSGMSGGFGRVVRFVRTSHAAPAADED